MNHGFDFICHMNAIEKQWKNAYAVDWTIQSIQWYLNRVFSLAQSSVTNYDVLSYAYLLYRIIQM